MNTIFSRVRLLILGFVPLLEPAIWPTSFSPVLSRVDVEEVGFSEPELMEYDS